MKQLLLFLLAVLGIFHIQAQTPHWAWVKNSSHGYGQSANIGVDSAGNSYVANYYDSSAIIEQIPIHNNQKALILTKYNANGYVQFAKELKGIPDNIIGIAVDPAGSTFVASGFTGHVAVDTFNISSVGSSPNTLVAKYNIAGSIMWVRNIYLDDASNYKGFTVDSRGNTYINAVSRTGYAIIGTDTFAGSVYRPSIFTIKFDPSGNIKWVRPLYTKNAIETYSIAVDKNENVYVAGYHRDSLFKDSLGQQLLVQSESFDANFIAKYNKDGIILLMKDIMCNPDWSMATSDNGDLFVYGVYDDSMRYGQLRVGSGNGYFLLKCDSSGSLIWGKTIRDMTYVDFRNGLSIDKLGNAYTLGKRSDTLTVGNVSFTTKGTHSYLLKHDAAGNTVWGYSFNKQTINDICADKNGNVFVSGRMASIPVDSFGSIVIDSRVVGSVFTAKFSDQAPNSIAPNRLNAVRVYPNPSNGHLTIIPDNPGYNHLEITDQLGRIIYSQPIASGEKRLEIRLNNTANGLYFLQLSGDHVLATQKIIIAH